VELYSERPAGEPVVYVPDAYGRMVPVLRSQADALIAAVPATAPRDLTPQPLLDSRAQLVIATGVGTGAAAAGVGWGLGQVLAPLAALTSSGLLWAVCLAAVIAGTGGRRTARGGDTYVTHNHNSAKWWGKSASTTHNGR
jgi:hypothetical protein